MREEAQLVRAAAHAREAKLNMIVFPAADGADFKAAGWLTEDEEATRGTGINGR
jgi:hypothetical protein